MRDQQGCRHERHSSTGTELEDALADRRKRTDELEREAANEEAPAVEDVVVTLSRLPELADGLSNPPQAEMRKILESIQAKITHRHARSESRSNSGITAKMATKCRTSGRRPRQDSNLRPTD